MRPLTERDASDDLIIRFFSGTIGERYPSVFVLARVNIPLTYDYASSGNARRRSFITR